MEKNKKRVCQYYRKVEEFVLKVGVWDRDYAYYSRRKIEIITENIPDRNDSWKEHFTAKETEKLNLLMKSPLEKFEYL